MRKKIVTGAVTLALWQQRRVPEFDEEPVHALQSSEIVAVSRASAPFGARS